MHRLIESSMHYFHLFYVILVILNINERVNHFFFSRTKKFNENNTKKNLQSIIYVQIINKSNTMKHKYKSNQFKVALVLTSS
ncbi:hypothetical protein Hanom_Chr01g00087711 [Helianthus anomalus]